MFFEASYTVPATSTVVVDATTQVSFSKRLHRRRAISWVWRTLGGHATWPLNINRLPSLAPHKAVTSAKLCVVVGRNNAMTSSFVAWSSIFILESPNIIRIYLPRQIRKYFQNIEHTFHCLLYQGGARIDLDAIKSFLNPELWKLAVISDRIGSNRIGSDFIASL